MIHISKPYQPKHRVILPSTAHYFFRNDYQLSWTGRILTPGATIKLGSLVTLHYDHRSKDAAPFIMNDREYYLIIEEIRIDDLREKLIELTRKPTLASITTEGAHDHEVSRRDSATVHPLLRLLRGRSDQ